MSRALTALAFLAMIYVASARFCFEVDWETDQNGNPMGNNQTIGNSWSMYFTTSARGRGSSGGSLVNTQLRTYNSSSIDLTGPSPTGSGDSDLGTPNRRCTGCPAFSGSTGRTAQCPGVGSGDGNTGTLADPKSARNSNCVRRNLVAIIQNPTGFIPNDAAAGGEAWFNFTQDVIISRVGVLDVDTNEPGGDAITYDRNLQQLSVEHFGANGDNTWSNNPIDQASVRYFKVILAGSGAITNFEFCLDDQECPRALCGPCDADTRVSSVNCLLNGAVVHHHTSGTALGVAFADITDTTFGSGCVSNGPTGPQ